MTTVIANLTFMVIAFFVAITGTATAENRLDIVFSDHAVSSHSESRYNARTIASEITKFNNNWKSSCDDVQIHLCTHHLGQYNPHAKIVCTNAGWKKESTVLVVSMKNFTTEGPVIVTGYKTNNSRIMRQIFSDKCIPLSLSSLDNMIGFYDKFTFQP